MLFLPLLTLNDLCLNMCSATSALATPQCISEISAVVLLLQAFIHRFQLNLELSLFSVWRPHLSRTFFQPQAPRRTLLPRMTMRGLVLRHEALSRSREVRTKTTMRCSRKDMHQSHNLRKFYSIILAVCIHCRIFTDNFLCGSLSRHNPIYTISLIPQCEKKKNTLRHFSYRLRKKITHTHTDHSRERNGTSHQFVFCKSKQIDWKSIFNFVRNIRAPIFLAAIK